MPSLILKTMRHAALLMPLVISACGPAVAPPAAPVPAPPPAPAAPPPRSGDWRDWPLAAGAWRYVPGAAVSAARYGDPQAAQFVVQCDVPARRITLMRAGSTGELSIITSTRTVRLPAGHIDDHGIAMSGAVVNATDPFLDALVFSRGRIAIRSPGLPDLAIPTWAEPARAIEDCRK